MTQAATAPAKPSALAALRALGKKPDTTTLPAETTSLTDPAITGAKRDRNTVRLGYDPVFAKAARYTANLHTAMERAAADFSVFQSQTRDYGLSKRGVYNQAYKADVTTVCVPYPEHVIEGEDGTFQPAPGSEMKWIQVICTNRFSVNQEMVLANQDRIGENFPRLFEKSSSKTLKPNAEQLFRDLLVELGAATEETVGDIMAQLFDTTTQVTASKNYEKEFEGLPAAVQDLLKQMVTRAQPGLKFPG